MVLNKTDMATTIDIWTLFLALLTTALLQEFAIKPSVDFIKKYYNKSHRHLKKMLEKEERQKEG